MNNKEPNAKRLPIKVQPMMITMNLSRAFFILMYSYALFSTFRGSFRADCIEQFNFWKKRRRKKRGLRSSVHIRDNNIRPFADVIAWVTAHSPQIFYDSECWSGLGLKPSTSGALQRELTRQRYLRAYWHFLLLFTHITDIDTPDKIDTWGAVTCHRPQNPLLTKSENRMLMAYVWNTHLS